jgi:beta-glucosidase
MPAVETDEGRILELIGRMTLEEKIGQTALRQASGGRVDDALAHAIREGRVGAVLNEVDVDTVNALQRLAVEESRLGIPLLVGRDVIHGFSTVFPIPLGQAASWNPALVQRGARIAAHEAAACGVNWTFAPMIDIARDPRWGRVAESFGEDPYLSALLGVAAVRGFQGDDLAAPGSIAACAKHFAGYGAAESGRDYNTTSIPEVELRNVYLPPFQAAVDAGVATLMTSFSDLNGVPCTANEWLLRHVLRNEWGFRGLVVSDWESVSQLQVHGLTADDRESALEAAQAGVDLEMTSATYEAHLAALVREERLPIALLDAMVANVLRVKLALGLFDRPYTRAADYASAGNAEYLDAAREAARESIVLLKNDGALLPLAPQAGQTVAVIGPLADAPFDQLGTWIFDGDARLSRTPLAAIRELAADGAMTVEYVRAVETTRSRSHAGFAEAVAAADRADVVLCFVGEEAILSGEAHCRADITLPGAQEALIDAVAATGTPVVLVVLAGRPLALERVASRARAIVYAWHPGTMGGPAIADLLFGAASPVGRLPITLPRVTGQVPIYYAEKRTGKPATPETITHIDDIAASAPQLSIGNTSFHLDVHPSPLYPFGHGLAYTTFAYEALHLSASELAWDDTLTVTVDVVNTGERHADETVQLYVRDPVASVTRPVRELKRFARIPLAPGERRTVTFALTHADLAFSGRDHRRRAEPGAFDVWVGGSSAATLHRRFILRAATASLSLSDLRPSHE